MNDFTAPPSDATCTPEVEALIKDLEHQMPDLQMRHGNVFALANAWAERYDAIIAATPREMQASVEARLSRIGIRWGMMPGARVTTEFRALDNLIPHSERLGMLSRRMASQPMASERASSQHAPSQLAPSQHAPLPGAAPHDATTTTALASPALPPCKPAVTTSSQQTVLSNAELTCLLDCARGTPVVDRVAAQALVAKGMLEDADGNHVLTPAGHHALHVGQPGSVPGIDT
jgi:hypothetical protein